jgi:hypothetical protein
MSVRQRIYDLSPLVYKIVSAIYEATPLARRRAERALASMREGNAQAAAFHIAAYHRFIGSELKILAGPFAGMAYIESSSGSLLGPKLVGSYESEIMPWIFETISNPPARIIDIGSAEGYYAIGFAWRCPSVEIVAFDSDADARQSCLRLASLNGVSNRVTLLGSCNIATLRPWIMPGTLIFCDIEGFERHLLNPRRIPELRRSAIVVETHDHLAPGTSNLLMSRFGATHQIESQSARYRFSNEFAPLRTFPAELHESLLNEGRPPDQRWLRLSPRHYA